MPKVVPTKIWSYTLPAYWFITGNFAVSAPLIGDHVSCHLSHGAQFPSGLIDAFWRNASHMLECLALILAELMFGRFQCGKWANFLTLFHKILDEPLGTET